MTVGPALLEVTGVAKAFGPTQALDGVDLTVHGAQVHALLGGNGSGKSSLVKILAGVYQADAGTITLNGVAHDATAYRGKDGHAGGLRFVHQDLGLVETATVAENVAFVRGFPRGVGGRVDWRALHRSTAELLARYEIDASPRTPIAALRPADRTMVAIARALGDNTVVHNAIANDAIANDAVGRDAVGNDAVGRDAVGNDAAGHDSAGRLLVLDEPTASLSRHESDLLLAAIRRRAAQGQGIVLISHHLHEVLDVADTITVLRDGRVAGRLTAAEADEDTVVTLIAGRAVELGAGRAVHLAAEQSGVQQSGVQKSGLNRDQKTAVLRVQGLAAGPLDGVDLTVHAGEIVGVTGLVGSGRTSLMRAVFGALPVRSGTIEIDGTRLAAGGPAAAMRAGVALVPEDRAADAAFPDHTVQRNMSATVTRGYWRHGWMRSRRERQDTVDLIDRFGVRAAGPGALLSTLSGGNQQKAIVARWLRRRPRVLLLDEPTQGVDVVSRADIYRLVREAAAEGCAVVVASSDAEEISLLCQRALVLADGKVVAELDGDHLDPDTQLRAAHAGRDHLIGVRS